jgi:hypothetical protein
MSQLYPMFISKCSLKKLTEVGTYVCLLGLIIRTEDIYRGEFIAAMMTVAFLFSVIDARFLNPCMNF